MSTYIIDRAPSKYGSQQQSYIAQVDSIVTETADAFRVAVELKKDLKELFHHTLASLGATRSSMAVKHNTSSANQFGIRRDDHAAFEGPSSMTPLSSPYEEYNERLLPILQKHLRTMKHTLTEFQQTELKVSEEKCLGRASSMEFAIFPAETMKNWAFFFTPEEYKRICGLCLIPPSEAPFEVTHFKDLVESRDVMQKLKQVSIGDYKRLNLVREILEIRQRYEGRKSDWVLVTVRSEVDGKMYALSQYLTWCNRDFKEDPVEHMTRHSIITLIHQDAFLIDAMLTDIAAIFEKAITWKGENVTTLKEHVALFQYELAHAMPFKRGSAAISEWLEMAIYRYHGFSLSYNPKKMVNLEALTSSLKQFIENYDSMIQLAKSQ